MSGRAGQTLRLTLIRAGYSGGCDHQRPLRGHKGGHLHGRPLAPARRLSAPSDRRGLVEPIFHRRSGAGKARPGREEFAALALARARGRPPAAHRPRLLPRPRSLPNQASRRRSLRRPQARRTPSPAAYGPRRRAPRSTAISAESSFATLRSLHRRLNRPHPGLRPPRTDCRHRSPLGRDLCRVKIRAAVTPLARRPGTGPARRARTGAATVPSSTAISAESSFALRSLPSRSSPAALVPRRARTVEISAESRSAPSLIPSPQASRKPAPAAHGPAQPPLPPRPRSLPNQDSRLRSLLAPGRPHVCAHSARTAATAPPQPRSLPNQDSRLRSLLAPGPSHACARRARTAATAPPQPRSLQNQDSRLRSLLAPGPSHACARRARTGAATAPPSTVISAESRFAPALTQSPQAARTPAPAAHDHGYRSSSTAISAESRFAPPLTPSPPGRPQACARRARTAASAPPRNRDLCRIKLRAFRSLPSLPGPPRRTRAPPRARPRSLPNQASRLSLTPLAPRPDARLRPPRARTATAAPRRPRSLPNQASRQLAAAVLP